MSCGRHSASVLLAGSLLTALSACAPSLSPPETAPTAAELRSLWREPTNVESRDLFYGAGGRELAPGAGPFTFVERKSTGTNPGYDVRDSSGALWSVKLGREAQSEVVLSRVLWAVGYHQPPVYFVPQWQMIGDERGEHLASRFRREMPEHEVEGDWSWYDNPFIGTRPFAGLVAINFLLNNWDLKEANNKIYAVKVDGRVERRYLVRDLGGSLGSAMQPAVLSWMPFMRWMQGSRNDLEDFERQDFIKGVDGDRVDFHYRGLDGELAESVTPADLRWTVSLLERLSEAQWLDAFRAAGYADDVQRRYVRKIQAKLAEARQATNALGD